MPHLCSRQSAYWTMWRSLLLPLAVVATGPPHEHTTCDMYSVELQAVFPNDTAIPCTEEETTIIEALIHSLVQTDAIVGLNRMIPVPAFFLAFEKFGQGVTRLSSFEEEEFLVTQMELSLPHLTVEDRIEDMYYDSGYTEPIDDHTHNNTVYNHTEDHVDYNYTDSDDHIYHNDTYNHSALFQASDDKGESGKEIEDESLTSSEDNHRITNSGNGKLVPPPPVILADGSLRQGGPRSEKGNPKHRKLHVTPEPTPAPTPYPTAGATSNLRGTQSPTPASTPSSSSSQTPGETSSSTETPSPTSTTQSNSSTPAPTSGSTDAPSFTPAPTPGSTPSATSDGTLSPTSDAGDGTPSPTSSTPQPTPAPTPGSTAGSTSQQTLAATSGSTPNPTSGYSPETPAPTPIPTPSPTQETPAPTDNGLDCEADWCAWFITRPCDEIPRDPDYEATERFKAELEAFQERVQEQIERKLRKWARDTDAMCLGNSWQLKAVVKRLL